MCMGPTGVVVRAWVVQGLCDVHGSYRGCVTCMGLWCVHGSYRDCGACMGRTGVV